MSDIIVRVATLLDEEPVKSLLDRSWRAHWAPYLDAGAWARYEVAQPVIGYVDAYLGQFQVAERRGVVVGMFHLEGPVLHAIHVDSWTIGTGVGTALMNVAENRGARRLVVRAFNARAREFFRRRGWREVDEFEDFEMGTAVRTIQVEL